jgi:hypothetical protein
MPASEILFMRTYIGGFGPQCLFRNDNHRNQSFSGPEKFAANLCAGGFPAAVHV